MFRTWSQLERDLDSQIMIEPPVTHLDGYGGWVKEGRKHLFVPMKRVVDKPGKYRPDEWRQKRARDELERRLQSHCNLVRKRAEKILTAQQPTDEPQE